MVSVERERNVDWATAIRVRVGKVTVQRWEWGGFYGVTAEAPHS